MIDISSEISTQRIAVAQAVVKVSVQETIDTIRQQKVPKGDLFEMAKTAGLLGVKKTADLIPECHPMPIEYTAISYEVKGMEIRILVEVKAIYKTGVEMEAMHGASVVALTMYDMLKSVDKGVEIQSIKLVEQKGGKSNFRDKPVKALKAAVVVCSDAIITGRKGDTAGKAIVKKLKESNVEVEHYEIIPNEMALVQEKAKHHSSRHLDVIIFAGGTGSSARDVTPEAIIPLLDRQIPGIMEAARNYGQQRTPYAMLSRGIAGVMGNSLILVLPGSTNGARETMDALFPSLLHIFRTLSVVEHD